MTEDGSPCITLKIHFKGTYYPSPKSALYDFSFWEKITNKKSIDLHLRNYFREKNKRTRNSKLAFLATVDGRF